MKNLSNNSRWLLKMSLIVLLALAFFWVIFFFCIEKANDNNLPDGVSLMPVHVNDVYPSWLYFEVEPGEVVDSSFLVWNGYEETAKVDLGSLDAVLNATLEDFELKIVQDEQVGIGAWAQVEVPNVLLDARSQAEVHFVMTIPENAEEGTYLGAVYGSYSPEVSVDSPFKTIYQNGLRVIVNVTNDPQEVSMIGANVSMLPQVALTYFSVSVMITIAGLMSLVTAYRNAKS